MEELQLRQGRVVSKMSLLTHIFEVLKLVHIATLLKIVIGFKVMFQKRVQICTPLLKRAIQTCIGRIMSTNQYSPNSQ